MKVLLIGERYSTNLGDGVICESVEHMLSEIEGIKIKTVDISGREGYREYKNLNTNNKVKNLKRNIKEIAKGTGLDIDYYKFRKAYNNRKQYIKEVCNEDFDLAVFAGGQMFKDTFVFSIKSFVEVLSEKNIPVIFNACGVGNIQNYKLQNLLKSALSTKNISSVTTRDDIDTLNNYYLKSTSINAVTTFDPAIWVRDIYETRKKNSEVTGLGVMDVNHIDNLELIDFWINIISNLNTKKIKWKLFCNGDERDYQLSKDILTKAGYDNNDLDEYICKRPKTPKELVELISTFKSIISFRLHSHIIAYSLDIPAVALVWDEKVRYFYRTLNEDQRCKTISSDIEELINELEDAECRGYNDVLRNHQKKVAYDLLVNKVENVRNKQYT
ncbi:polysaccharide pyruvyl transferase family protein [Halobacillus litoralis]|uniref:polysaccharide pyruvyl transferase family protein n=1 Tax=Halobacillus litoralis TaxID=45668 RepID=UPI001CFD04DE|nr:polysaccharide pyruvyl transferase family protein [Halobacillus litoralis]WLR49054.1 polysaccharide pyruvyl transferase family protein [Halobacillus litoralis]